jgi:hypothetical protein
MYTGEFILKVGAEDRVQHFDVRLKQHCNLDNEPTPSIGYKTHPHFIAGKKKPAYSGLL